MNASEVGKQIQLLRKVKGLTQNELGERLGVSFQAVSKWERGETLPDTALLPDLAAVLETSIDNILLGSQRVGSFRRRIKIAQIREAVDCLVHLGELLGKDNAFYLGAIEGVDRKMNLDMETYLYDDFTKEALIAEAAIQCIQNGDYLDLSDIQKGFVHQHWQRVVMDNAKKHNIV